MKFTRVKDKRTGITYDWMADITSVADLMVLEEGFAGRNARDILEFVQSKDYAHAMNERFVKSVGKGDVVPHGGDHCRPSNKIAPYLYASVYGIPEGKEIVPMVYFAQRVDWIVSQKAKSLEKYGRILVNKNGGYFMWHDDLEELESVESNRFPQYEKKDVKVSRWPDCKHWYITCNGTTVEVDGVPKWGTEKSAWEAAERWLKES